MTSETTTGQGLCDRIDQLIAERSLLKHPFYTKWQAGELTLDAIKGYACQYYHHVLQFPTYVSGAHANCDDLPDRQELLENLVEEEQGHSASRARR
jgi:pyrroloquinoline-quinone synthase